MSLLRNMMELAAFDWQAEALACAASPAACLALGRRIADLARERATAERAAVVNVAVLASHTVDMLLPMFIVEAAKRGLLLNVATMPFGQLEPLICVADSALYAAQPDVVVLANLLDENNIFGDRFTALAGEQANLEVASFTERTRDLLLQLRQHCAAQIVVWNQPPPARLAYGLADAWLAPRQRGVRSELNDAVARVASSISGVSVFDVDSIASELGTRTFYDMRMALLARQPFSTAGNLALAAGLARHTVSRRRAARKCIVVDLDNTLWGGVVGEDGVSGIKLGDEFPGNAFKAFQRVLKSYRDRGFLLAIASKNNAQDVKDVFDTHSDMVLQWDDFSAREIHWNDKASSLRAIATTLNIGIDALVFVDDNPMERAWVQEQLPDVLVVDLPKEPFRYVAALDAVEALDQWMLTSEDRERATLYQSEQSRAELRSQVGSAEDFLQALQIRAVVGPIDGASQNRVVQLLGKTNQFNVTTRRHSDAELQALLAQPGAFGYWMRTSDRFGDHGLIAVALVVPHEGATYRIDSFLMSCRVLGRQLERALMAAVVQRVQQQGGTALLGEFIATRKNAPASALFATMKFADISAVAGPGWWRLAELEEAAQVPPFVELVVESAAHAKLD